MLQRHAVEKLHHHEHATVFFADVVDGADVGMVQCGGGACLAAKALQRLAVVSHFVGKKLKGDKPAQARVLSLVDYPHPAAAQFSCDAVVRDSGVDHGPGASKMRPDDERAIVKGSQFAMQSKTPKVAFA